MRKKVQNFLDVSCTYQRSDQILLTVSPCRCYDCVGDKYINEKTHQMVGRRFNALNHPKNYGKPYLNFRIFSKKTC